MANSDRSQVLRELRKILSPFKEETLTDGQLLEKYLATRDERAFEALVRRHGGMVLGVCRRILGHIQDAEDAYQATFLVLARKASQCQSREAVGNWLYGVAYCTAHKARAVTARQSVKEKQVDVLPESALEPEENWRELIPLLDRELSRLPDKYRLPVVLCELEGRARKEVARQLGVPEGTLSSRLATARKMLARRLAKHGPLLSGAAISSLLAEGEASAGMLPSLVKTAVLAAAGKVAVPARVTVLVQGASKAMFLAKLKAVTWVLVLLTASAGAAGLKYRTSTIAEPQQGSQPVPAGVVQDELEALRLEIAALRKDLQATRQRVHSLEGELHTLKTESSKSQTKSQSVEELTKQIEEDMKQIEEDIKKRQETAREVYEKARKKRIEEATKKLQEAAREVYEKKRLEELDRDAKEWERDANEIIPKLEKLGLDKQSEEIKGLIKLNKERLKNHLRNLQSETNPPLKEVEGVVKTADNSRLLKLSIGSDDGLVTGNTLEVYRVTPKPLYLGRVRIVDVRPHESVAQPIGQLNDKLRPGDHVSSRIRENP